MVIKSNFLKNLLFPVCLFVSLFYTFYLETLNILGETLFLDLHLPKTSRLVLYSNLKIQKLLNSESYQTRFLLGRVEFVLGDLSKSVNHYSESIVLEPKFKEAYYGRGLSYGFMGSDYLTQGESDFLEYIELEKLKISKTGHESYGAWAAYNDLAWIYFLQGDFKKSKSTVLDGLSISNYNPWLLNMLGILELEEGNCEHGKIALKNAKDILNSISPSQFGEAYSGDKPTMWEVGMTTFKKTIETNQSKCQLND